jgi:CMP-N-acetylneuraminic acid synthetase
MEIAKSEMGGDILAVVTARGGSKGVPKKNLRSLAGKPLVVWTIEAAIAAKSKMRIIVSTDSHEIADVCRLAGAEVPFLRPTELASDYATAKDAVIHSLDWLYEHEQYSPHLVVLLQPTSPFRSSRDIDNALDLQMETNVSAVIGVTENRRPVEWLQRVDSQGRISDFSPGNYISRRQETEKLYLYNGAVYVIKTEALRRGNTFCPDDRLAYVMPPERSLDIDSELDFLTADLLMQYQLKNRCLLP